MTHVFFSINTNFTVSSTSTTGIYTLSLHDALPISRAARGAGAHPRLLRPVGPPPPARGHGQHHRAVPLDQEPRRDRKSTRLNSSHVEISYAVFCLKKKN